MNSRGRPFRIAEGEAVRLGERLTRISPVYSSKIQYRKKLIKRIHKISKLQRALQASSRSALLVVIQGMDAGGKDGIIRHVLSGINPQGCQVHNFEPPSDHELKHDFLWRTAVKLPAHGLIGVFNRSYYDYVLIFRIHPQMLGAEFGDHDDAPDRVWEGRFQSILDHEAHLLRNGTKIIKLFLHLSKDEQCRRFLRRIDHPEKNWKFDVADIAERRLWEDYARAYEDCLSKTSTADAPWFIIPADDKKTARLIIADLILGALEDLAPTYPDIGGAQKQKLSAIRSELTRA